MSVCVCVQRCRASHRLTRPFQQTLLAAVYYEEENQRTRIIKPCSFVVGWSPPLR